MTLEAPPAGEDDAVVTDPAETTAEQPAEGKLRYSNEDFLRLVRDERRRSVGFGDGDSGELARVRIKAQEYRQGVIKDIKTLEGRSSAVDTSLSDAVDTVMPDVMEVFFGGDDVVTFDADGEADEAQAREESDVLAQVVFGQNDAFRAFHDAIQDALLNRTGLFHWWWESDDKVLGTQEAPNGAMAAAIVQLLGQRVPHAQVSYERRDDGSIAISFSEKRGKACFKAFPSEDFSVAADTVVLRDTAYCVLRDRPRVQDLIARGVEKTLARSLQHYTSKQDELARARDQAGENDRASENGLDDLRVVEVRAHYIRLDADDDGELEIWRVETDGEETQLLRKEQVRQIPFGALTPYLNAHRFYGESLFDKLAEVMRVKTVLQRMLLDSGYFALNQRYEVSDDASNEFTIADLLNNAPNVPVRSKDGKAVRALTAGQLGFDVMGALEFMATVAEQRSGVVRNAQGLNPDTLHKTAAGVAQLVAAANKRVRMICRVFAETGVKDLVLGIHQMLREEFTEAHAPMNKKVGRAWKQVRPDTWPEREALTVHVGVGSSAKDRDLDVQHGALDLTKEIITLQGGVNGPFVTPQNVFNRLKAFSRAAGEKDVSLYFTDPGEGEIEAPGQGQQDPAMAKASMDAEIAKLKLKNEMELGQMRLQGELEIQRAEMQGRLTLEQEKARRSLQLQQAEARASAELEARKLEMGDRHLSGVNNQREALPGGIG